jgi:hypothetical protein
MQVRASTAIVRKPTPEDESASPSLYDRRAGATAMILDAHGKPVRTRGISESDILEVAMAQCRRTIEEAMFRRIVRLYDANGQLAYTDLGFGGLAQAISSTPIQENLSWTGFTK